MKSGIRISAQKSRTSANPPASPTRASPFRIRQAEAEVEQRRKERETYTVPITIKPGKASISGNSSSDDNGTILSTKEEVESVKAFKKKFYSQFYTKPYKKELQSLLGKHPDLAKFHQQLVISQKLVQEEDFWQNYLYRCNVDRILDEWQRKPHLVPSSKRINSRARALRESGGTINRLSNKKKGESISERFDRMTRKTVPRGGDPYATTADGTAKKSTNCDDKAGSKFSGIEAVAKTSRGREVVANHGNTVFNEDSVSETVAKNNNDLQKIKKFVVWVLIVTLLCDYSRRLGIMERICQEQSANMNWLASLSSQTKHAVDYVCPNGGGIMVVDLPNPRKKRRGFGRNNEIHPNAGGGGDNNPLLSSWRKIAERTVNRQNDNNLNSGMALQRQGEDRGIIQQTGGSEGIVGYFMDKFGRAGVVVEQHVVHHHVHHVVHEHR